MTGIAASFDRAARDYLAHAGVQERMAGWLAEWLPADRSGPSLEIGAGPGLFTRRLLPWNGPLVATDLSPAMCDAGRAAVPEVEWRMMAAEKPDRGPWAWIFSSSMLQWAADPAAVFSAWRRCLAPHGRVLAGLFVSESLPEWSALAGGLPLTFRSAEEWHGYALQSGFRVLRDQSERRACPYPSARALLRSLHGIGAAPERRLQPGKLRRLLREYESRHRVENGVAATWTFYRLELSVTSTRS